MGLFSDLFASRPAVEKKLEATYVPIFQSLLGMSATQARKEVLDFIEKAKAEVKAAGVETLPDQYGNFLLLHEKSDQKIFEFLKKRRREGVTDSDILWWWNLHYLERQFDLHMNDIHRSAAFIANLKKGHTPEQAARMMNKLHAYCGDPDDQQIASGEDRPLPSELQKRITSYSQRRMATDLQGYLDAMEESSSFNALVRKEMRLGKL